MRAAHLSSLRFALAPALAACLGLAVLAPARAADRISLSLDQQAKVGQAIVDEKPTAVSSTALHLAVDGTVPSGVSIRPLPTAAAKAAPALQGYGYVVVEEQSGLVDPTERKIVAVIQRARPQTP